MIIIYVGAKYIMSLKLLDGLYNKIDELKGFGPFYKNNFTRYE